MRQERLERLLRDGGCLAPAARGQWAVYRSHDRRRRKLALIDASRVETLRAQGALAVLPDMETEILIWSRRAEVFAPIQTLQARPQLPQLRKDADEQLRCSLLTRILLRMNDDEMRRQLAIAALNWRQDVSEGDARGYGHGMNWPAICAGTRIDASFTPRDSCAASSGAADRVAALKRAMSKEEVRLLDLMVLTDGTRHAIAQKLGEKELHIEKAGLRVLKQLADLYRRAAKQPGQGRPSA